MQVEAGDRSHGASRAGGRPQGFDLTAMLCAFPVNIFQGWQQEVKLCPQALGLFWDLPPSLALSPSLFFPLRALSEQKSEQLADVGGLPGTAKFIL